MAKDITFSNVYCCYIKNQRYEYPWEKEGHWNTTNNHGFNTGYHVAPTILFKHFLTPKQWIELNIGYESVCYQGYDLELFNMVPTQGQLSFDNNRIWTNFNSTIYAIAYQDPYYETNLQDWFASTMENNQPNFMYKEGMLSRGQSIKQLLYWPIYFWKQRHSRAYNQHTFANDGDTDGGIIFPTVGNPKGAVWDPLNEPDKILEFRPGKNSIKFSDRVHPVDDNKFFNLDATMSWEPYTPTGPYNGKPRPKTGRLTNEMDPDRLTNRYEAELDSNLSLTINDWTMPDWFNQPVCPLAWTWNEISSNIISKHDVLKPDKFFPGTEREKYLYPPKQCFIKLIPIFDEQFNLIPLTAQVCVRISLHLKGIPRKSAIYCPTWGPFTGPNIYGFRARDMQFPLNYVRYRTSGIRRGLAKQTIRERGGRHHT